MHADTPLAADTSMVQHIIKTVGDHKEHDYAGINIKKMSVQGFQEVSFQPRLFVNADPQENYEVATKKYVDQHAGGGEYVPLNNNLCCYISEIGGGVYKCDCYLLEQFNMKGTISANEDSFAKSINHNLNDYLEKNNYYVIGGSLDTFIFMGAGGGHTIITCTGHLYSTSLTLKIITTTFESEDKTIDRNINAGKVGSMLLRKNR